MSSEFPGLTLPVPGTGPITSADDLLLISDLTEMEIVVDGWKHRGVSLRLRVKALDFEQQEKIERLALVKIDGKLVRSEAAFAAHTLFEAVIAPKLTIEQAHQMARKRNPRNVNAVVTFVWNTLSLIDQDFVDAFVNEQIPGAAEPDADPSADAVGADDPPIAEFTPAEAVYAS